MNDWQKVALRKHDPLSGRQIGLQAEGTIERFLSERTNSKRLCLFLCSELGNQPGERPQRKITAEFERGKRPKN